MSPRAKIGLAVAAAAIAVAALVALLVDLREPPKTPTDLVPTTWEGARLSPMHQAHVAGKKTVPCTECHADGASATAAGVKPEEATCARCHEEKAKRAHRGAEGGDRAASTTCLTCHAFGANKKGASCADCHAEGAKGPAALGKEASGSGKEAASAHALAHHVKKDVACKACHDVHGDKPERGQKGGARVALPDCTACHTNVSAVHGSAASVAYDVPATSNAHEASAPEAGAHDGGARGASAPGDGPRDADAWDGADAALRYASDVGLEKGLRASAMSTPSHATPTGAMCSTCHAPHGAAADAKAACAGCHEGHPKTPNVAGVVLADVSKAPHVEARGRNVAGHPACTTCHEPHRAKKEAVLACESCHAERRHVAEVPGHQRCTQCHAPHAPGAAGVSCTHCHEGKAALAATKISDHARCESCHDVHAPKASPAQACNKCHERVSPKHPAFAAKGGASACTGCHAPHPGSRGAGGARTTATATVAPGGHPSTGAAACSSCHTKAKSDVAFHASAGKTACTGCHVPHQFASGELRGAAACARCHQPMANAVAARSGHAECKACHGDAHAPNKKPACGTCHGAEAKSAPAGHAACTQCHDGHSGALGTRASCGSCHANKTKAQHGALATGCTTCHRPHGPNGVASPPACTTCHTKDKLDGLHRSPTHAQSCASCHTSHGPPRSDRATCTTTCHVDRQGHQPEAKVCKGCHMFKR